MATSLVLMFASRPIIGEVVLCVWGCGCVEPPSHAPFLRSLTVLFDLFSYCRHVSRNGQYITGNADAARSLPASDGSRVVVELVIDADAGTMAIGIDDSVTIVVAEGFSKPCMVRMEQSHYLAEGAMTIHSFISCPPQLLSRRLALQLSPVVVVGPGCIGPASVELVEHQRVDHAIIGKS